MVTVIAFGCTSRLTEGRAEDGVSVYNIIDVKVATCSQSTLFPTIHTELQLNLAVICYSGSNGYSIFNSVAKRWILINDCRYTVINLTHQILNSGHVAARTRWVISVRIRAPIWHWVDRLWKSNRFKWKRRHRSTGKRTGYLKSATIIGYNNRRINK